MVERKRLPKETNGNGNGHSSDEEFRPRHYAGLVGNRNWAGDGSVRRQRLSVTNPEEAAKRACKGTLFREEYVKQAQKLAEMGHTDTEIAQFFGVADSTFKAWKARFPELGSSLKAGKEVADDRVERSLYTRAVGFSVDTEKIFCSDGDIVRAKTKQYYPPDVAAAFIWLKNRRGWSDRARVEFTPGPDSFAQELKERLDKLEVPNEINLAPGDYKRVN